LPKDGSPSKPRLGEDEQLDGHQMANNSDRVCLNDSIDNFEEKDHLFCKCSKVFNKFIVYWRFDEGKGQIINDMSDNEISGQSKGG
jgi:hypothetical protein